VTEEQVAIKLTEHENRIKVSEHRINDLEKQQENIQQLTLSVNKMAMNIEEMVKAQKNQGERLQKIEEEPTERWNSAKKTALTTVVSTVAGALATGLLALAYMAVNGTF